MAPKNKLYRAEWERDEFCSRECCEKHRYYKRVRDELATWSPEDRLLYVATRPRAAA